jgi:hypothetical protein
MYDISNISDERSIVDRSGDNNNHPTNDTRFFAADACPRHAWDMPTTLEQSSALYNIVCCDSSMEQDSYYKCSKIFNQCTKWKNTKLSQLDAAQACEQLGPGHRLCTQEELHNEVCCHKGCNADHKKVWTSDFQIGKCHIA